MAVTTRLLVVDSHQEFRHDLISYLVLLGRGYEVVGDFGTAADALMQLDALHPDIVLIGLALQDSNGLAIARFITDLWPAVAVVILSDDAASYERESQTPGPSRIWTSWIWSGNCPGHSPG